MKFVTIIALILLSWSWGSIGISLRSNSLKGIQNPMQQSNYSRKLVAFNFGSLSRGFSSVNHKRSITSPRKESLVTNHASPSYVIQKQTCFSESRRKQLVSFLSGGLAGTISSCLTVPLEVVKTQLQASSTGSVQTATDICRNIFRKEGIGGFFRGLKPMLFGIIPTRAIYFWAYSGTKSTLRNTRVGDTSFNHLLSAFAAGIASNTVSTYFTYCIDRLQLLVLSR
jgi:hypothetical protein